MEVSRPRSVFDIATVGLVGRLSKIFDPPGSVLRPLTSDDDRLGSDKWQEPIPGTLAQRTSTFGSRRLFGSPLHGVPDDVSSMPFTRPG
jgi:hypothetical protein